MSRLNDFLQDRKLREDLYKLRDYGIDFPREDLVNVIDQILDRQEEILATLVGSEKEPEIQPEEPEEVETIPTNVTKDDVTGDWSNRIQTRAGRRIRILCVDAPKPLPIIALIEKDNGSCFTYSYPLEENILNEEDAMDIVEIMPESNSNSE